MMQKSCQTSKLCTALVLSGIQRTLRWSDMLGRGFRRLICDISFCNSLLSKISIYLIWSPVSLQEPPLGERPWSWILECFWWDFLLAYSFPCLSTLEFSSILLVSIFSYHLIQSPWNLPHTLSMKACTVPWTLCPSIMWTPTKGWSVAW